MRSSCLPMSGMTTRHSGVTSLGRPHGFNADRGQSGQMQRHAHHGSDRDHFNEQLVRVGYGMYDTTGESPATNANRRPVLLFDESPKRRDSFYSNGNGDISCETSDDEEADNFLQPLYKGSLGSIHSGRRKISEPWCAKPLRLVAQQRSALMADERRRRQSAAALVSDHFHVQSPNFGQKRGGWKQRILKDAECVASSTHSLIERCAPPLSDVKIKVAAPSPPRSPLNASRSSMDRTPEGSLYPKMVPDSGSSTPPRRQLPALPIPVCRSRSKSDASEFPPHIMSEMVPKMRELPPPQEQPKPKRQLPTPGKRLQIVRKRSVRRRSGEMSPPRTPMSDEKPVPESHAELNRTGSASSRTSLGRRTSLQEGMAEPPRTSTNIASLPSAIDTKGEPPRLRKHQVIESTPDLTALIYNTRSYSTTPEELSRNVSPAPKPRLVLCKLDSVVWRSSLDLSPVNDEDEKQLSGDEQSSQSSAEPRMLRRVLSSSCPENVAEAIRDRFTRSQQPNSSRPSMLPRGSIGAAGGVWCGADASTGRADLGLVRFSVQFFPARRRLRVSIDKAHGLGGQLKPGVELNVFAKICLMPGQLQKQKSRIVKNTRDALFNEEFFFDNITEKEIESKMIAVQICHVTGGNFHQKKAPIGEVTFALEHISGLLSKKEVYLYEELRSCSISKLNICKANDLPRDGIGCPPAPFIRIKITQNGNVQTKHTRTLKGTCNPTYKEVVMFVVSTKQQDIDGMSVEVLVMDSSRSIKDDAVVIGRVLLGPDAQEKSAVEQWTNTLKFMGKEFAMSHRLKH